MKATYTRGSILFITTLICYPRFVFSLAMPTQQRPRIPVLYYNDDWVCVHKPAGVSMYRSRNTNRSETVLTSALKRQLARKVYPVHRLDHRTSGAVLLAFDSKTCGELHKSLTMGTKEYIALIRGAWKYANDTVIVDKPLVDATTNITKSARTTFTMLATQDNATLVLCQPQTGRIHQIRRHSRELGHPIIGDSQHGDSKVNRWWREQRHLNRLALHCLSISLDDNTVISAPLSPEFKGVLEKEPLWPRAIVKEPRLLLEPVDERGGSHGRNYRKRKERMEKAFEEYDRVTQVTSLPPTLVMPPSSSFNHENITAIKRQEHLHLRRRRFAGTFLPLLGTLRRSKLMLFSNLALSLSALRLLPWRAMSMWTIGPSLALYLTAEAVFWALFHFHILPTCNVPAEPQAYRGYGKDRHRLMLRIIERIERTCRATNTPFLPAFTSYINEWFHHDGPRNDLEMPRKENMDELFSWAFFGKDRNHLEKWMEEELQLIYDMLESRYKLVFAPGVNSSLRPMRVSLDPLEPAYRPLLIYMLFGSVQVIANLFLRAAGFRFYTTSNRLRYWYRPNQSALFGDSMVEEGFSRSNLHCSLIGLPLLFFHGISPGGIAPYLPMILCGLARDGRPIMLFENPCISFNICLQSHTETETVEGVWEAVQARLGDKTGVSVVGHSFGSCQLTWLLHSKDSSRIRQVVLVDPVSVLLSEPDVLTNFLYSRKALQDKSRAIGVVANELCIERFLRRDFAWYNSELWLEDIPSHCKVVVCLADKDEILNADKIKREIDIHLEEKGGKLDLILWEGGGHAYCVTRPDAWKQLRLTMRQQEHLIAKEAELARQ